MSELPLGLDFSDLPVDADVERLEHGVNIRHLKVHEEGDGHGETVLARTATAAHREGLEYIVVNIGRGGRNDSVGFLEHLGFSIVETESDHVTAELELSDADRLV